MRSLVVAALGVGLVLASAPVAFANCAKDDPDGSKTLAARQEANSMCPCASATSHGAYVSCVAGVANMLSSGTNPSLPKTCKGAVKKCAAHSTCGRPGAVTCCLTNATTAATSCKIKSSQQHCLDKQGMPGTTCSSCCDACPSPGSGPSCSPSGAFLDIPAGNF
jgi:hypothetical protein